MLVTPRDGTQIFYKDWGSGPPLVFSHGLVKNAKLEIYEGRLAFHVHDGQG